MACEAVRRAPLAVASRAFMRGATHRGVGYACNIADLPASEVCVELGSGTGRPAPRQRVH